MEGLTGRAVGRCLMVMEQFRDIHNEIFKQEIMVALYFAKLVGHFKLRQH